MKKTKVLRNLKSSDYLEAGIIIIMILVFAYFMFEYIGVFLPIWSKYLILSVIMFYAGGDFVISRKD